MKRKYVSLLLSTVMAFNVFAMPVYASPSQEPVQTEQPVQTTEEEQATETEGVEEEAEGVVVAPEKQEEVAAEAKPETEVTEAKEEKAEVTPEVSTFHFDAEEAGLSDIGTFDAVADKEVEIDEKDPAVMAVADEVEDIKVVNEKGAKVPLTEEQKATVIGMFQQYQNHWKEHADVLGVQMPFYLQYNDKKDELGVLGEMLILANVSVEDVRSGNYSYDDLTGMIMNFMYGDSLGVQYYGSVIKSKRDAAVKAVKDSGAKTEIQKLLVLNNWLAQNNSFDMSYIMNAGKEEPVMVAENPQPHPHFKDVYDVIYKEYEKQIGDQFRGKIKEGLFASLRQTFYENAIKNAVYEQTLKKLNNGTTEGATDEMKAQATKAADQFMEENKDAITKDAPAFVKKQFGEEAAKAIADQADAFIKDVEENGVPDDKGNRTPVNVIVEAQMDQPLDDLQGQTPNQAVPVFAKEAATKLTYGVLNYWEGSHIGALAEGKSVCLGYSKAFAYILQFMHPEIYGKNGASTDMTVAANWKDAKDLYYNENGELDINKNYSVDLVRITFDADVTMYGETEEGFNSDHFWNAVKVDGKWYYIDPCYIDVFTEVMDRDRVETDGYLNNMYFMFSHTSAAELYEGYYKEIKTLYANAATDKQYEDGWTSRVKSDVQSDGSAFYYVYDSTDLIGMLGDFNADKNSFDMEEPTYKLVKHPLTDSDKGDGDKDYQALIEFNYKEKEDDKTSIARVYNPSTKAMEENKTLTKLYAQHAEDLEIYPSLKITAVLHNGKLYFNLSNQILSYELSTGKIVTVKEYKEVSATRDKTEAFGAMAFDVKNGGEFTVKNHPIAGMSLQNGKLKVAIATNFAYISGKDPHNSEDKDSYGYEFEETNYNAKYNSQYKENQMAQMMSNEVNDNDEFMWVANFVESSDMSSIAGGAKDEIVLRDACKHHYIRFDEEYYTKDSKSKKWNKGHCYVCTICGSAIDEPKEPKKNSMNQDHYEELKEQYEKDKKEYDAAKKDAGHKYVPTDAKWSKDSTSVSFNTLQCSSVCKEKQSVLDCLVDDSTITAKLGKTFTATAEVTAHEGTCDKGTTITYTAKGEAEGKKFTAVNKVEKAAGEHSYEGAFTWDEKKNEDGTVTYSAVVKKATCSVCGEVKENIAATVAKDDAGSKAPTCVHRGETAYLATATVKDENGKTIGTLTDKKVVETPVAGHQFEKNEAGKKICKVCQAEFVDYTDLGVKKYGDIKRDTVSREASAATAKKVADVKAGKKVVLFEGYVKYPEGSWYKVAGKEEYIDAKDAKLAYRDYAPDKVGTATANIWMRNGVGLGYDKVGEKITAGSTVQIYGYYSTDSCDWYYVNYKGTKGYVTTKYIDRADWVEYTPDRFGDFKKTVKVKSAWGAKGKDLGVSIKKGARVLLEGYAKTSKDGNWYRVTVKSGKNKITGYVKSDSCKLSYQAYKPTKTGVTKKEVVIRSGVGNNYSKVVTLKKGAKVTLLGYYRTDGPDWYKVKVNGKTGYVSSGDVTRK